MVNEYKNMSKEFKERFDYMFEFASQDIDRQIVADVKQRIEQLKKLNKSQKNISNSVYSNKELSNISIGSN